MGNLDQVLVTIWD